jgi:hypothetical protein
VTEQPLSSTFDIAPMWKMYMEPVEAWRKNYKTFLKSAPFRANGLGEISGAGLATSFYDGALLQWRKSGEELFRDLCSLKLTSGASLAGAGSSTSSFRSRSRSAAH